MRLTTLVPSLIGSALLATALDADACGGLFCSASNPVNQAAERIVFAQDGDRVHAVIEIQYAGPSSSFAWVLPVPGGEAVEVGVSSKQALDALQQASNPQYNFNTTFEQCPTDGDSSGGGFADAGVFIPDPPSEPSPGAIEVVVSGTVGPYDYVQLAVDESLPNITDVVIDWLADGGFDTENIGIDKLEPYLDSGLDLIAFRLTKGNDTGSIRPISLSWSADYPVIPIRPTAVAANDDMGVLVWVLGTARAIPTNYFHLELNEAKINWFNPSSTYNDVIIAAADEAGGQGFVTEQSTDAGQFRTTILPSFLEDEFEALRGDSFPTLESFFESVVQFGSYYDPATYEGAFYDGFLDTLSDTDLLPLREGATPEQFAACVSCYFEEDVPVANDLYPSTPYDPETDPILQVNVSAFLDSLEENVVTPMRETRALFKADLTVTRFYTTLSADEMTVDPAFDFNPDLDPVDNIHTADRYIRCNGSQSITLPQGFVVEAQDGSNWPVSVDDSLPLNYRILQLSLSGVGEVAIDNHERIIDELTELEIGGAIGDAPTPGDDDSDDDSSTGDDDSDDDGSASGADDDSAADDDSGDDDSATDDDSGDDDGATDDDSDDDGATDDDSGDDDASDDDNATDDDSDDDDGSNVVNDDADGDGCNCAVPGRGAGSSGLAWLMAVSVGVSLLRRRRRG